MNKKKRNILIGIAAISVLAAIIYLLIILIQRKKDWFNWFLKELKESETANKLGIVNQPNDETLKNLKELSNNILWPIRNIVKDWEITSGFRSGATNEAVGGVQNSQHLLGEAVDFKCSNLKEVFEYIKNNLEYDQIIWEKGTKESPKWIHVSYRKNNNRKKIIYLI